MLEPATATTAAAVTSIISALGVVGYVRRIWQDVRVHNRTLHGEPAVEGWDGITPMVQRHEDEIGELYELVEIDEQGRPHFRRGNGSD